MDFVLDFSHFVVPLIDGMDQWMCPDAFSERDW